MLSQRTKLHILLYIEITIYLVFTITIVTAGLCMPEMDIIKIEYLLQLYCNFK